jgi:dTDP-4-amino-4,6-dideoxygalactose transaminase
VDAVLRGDRLGGIGPFGERCEALLSELTTTSRVLLTPSCTHALEMAALLLDARPGDEVIVPAFTFVSTANAFAMHGLRPVFADCDPDTLNLNPAHVSALVSDRTRAVVAMHYGGVACDVDALQAVTRSRGLLFIEDNAHGLFGRYRGRPLGSFGAMGTQSFDETKNITCGQGGALLLTDPALVDRAQILRHRGTNRQRFLRGEVDKYTWVDSGSNWVLSELQAALLWGHLQERDGIQSRRRRVWNRYQDALAEWATAHGVRQPHIPEWAEHPAHLYYLLLPHVSARDAFIDHLGALGIQAVFHYGALNESPMGRRFGGRTGDCPVAESAAGRLVRLPFYDGMEPADQDAVLDAVTSFRP